MVTHDLFFTAVQRGDALTIAAFFHQRAANGVIPTATTTSDRRRNGDEWIHSHPKSWDFTSDTSLLETAIVSNYQDVVAWMVSADAIDTIGSQCLLGLIPFLLFRAHSLNNLGMLDILLSSTLFTQVMRADQRQALLNRLLYTVDLHHDVDIVKLVIAHGANVNMSRDTSTDDVAMLRRAALKTNLWFADVLIKNGAFVAGAQSFDWGIHVEESMLRFLLTHGAQLIADDGSPLHHAVVNGNVEQIRSWLEVGYLDVDARNTIEQTPLMLVSQVAVSDRNVGAKSAVEVARVLLEYGADISTKDQRGSTPLWYALDGSFPQVVALLLEHGADPNQSVRGVNVAQSFLLSQPSGQKGAIEKLEHLQKYGADLFLSDPEGQSIKDRFQTFMKSMSTRSLDETHGGW